MHMPNKRIKFAHCGRPTRIGEAPLLAASGVMSSVWTLLAAVALTACATPKLQTLLVTDYGYSLDGVSAADLSNLEKKLRPEDPIAVEACSCADAKLVIAAVEWLHLRGMEKVAMRTIDGEQAKCGVCK